MQVMLTNRSTVQVPILMVKGGKWYSDRLQPGIEKTIAGADVTELKIGRMSPGAPPSDPDSLKARDDFNNGTDCMLGRGGGPAVITNVRMFIENFEGTMTATDGTTPITLAPWERKEYSVNDAMVLTVA